MKVYKNPIRTEWNALAKRPILEQKSLDDIVVDILSDVKINKDKALLKNAEKFDGVVLDSLKVDASEVEEAIGQHNT